MKKNKEVKYKGSSFESLAKQIKSLQLELRNTQNIFEQRVNKLEMDVGNAYDLIEASSALQKIKAPTQQKFFSFCEKDLSMPFLEMDDPAKINALMQYLEKESSPQDTLLTQLIYAAFDKRNHLERLPDDQMPQMGDKALLMWRFTDQNNNQIGSPRPVIYNLGSNELGVDEKLLQMKRGEQKEFEMTFPGDFSKEMFRNKKGVLAVGIFDFKRKINSTTEKKKDYTPEEKKAIWKNNYKATEIE